MKKGRGKRKKVTENWGAGFSSSTIFSHLKQSLPQVTLLSLFKFSLFEVRVSGGWWRLWFTQSSGREIKWKREREREMGKGVSVSLQPKKIGHNRRLFVTSSSLSLYFLSFFDPLYDIRATSVVESKLYTYSFDFLSLSLSFSLFFLTLSYSLIEEGEEN